MNRKHSLVVLATALTLVTAACGSGGSDGAGEQTSAAPASPTESTVSPSDMTDEQQAPNRLVIDVTIKGGEVTPTNEQLQGKVGDPIVVRVNSDAADELHVHSNPEHNFPIEPRSGQQFQFTVDVPGTVDIELHQLNRVIASVQVQQ
ncbi:hypothetical protein D806_063830 [Mycolicibacterium smegmatis MKD8]|uniref:EfeO-type cupredoxin-like domain-containing protein n=2 Tax=Mycolicibacterium smegmatis TaxID=1772 RepID=A0A2U9PZT4_MYCSE|nr:hypothetical protein D806_063830 [Mycolicibacterium smegmatis MKD8]